jgi:amino acid adenylation domain-containing protein
VCGNDRLTYGELAARAEAVARWLLARGLRREELVCVCVEPSVWAPVAMLGVLAAGGAYVPLDPAYPPARLTDMLDQIGDARVLTTSATQRRPAVDGVVELDGAWPEIAGAAATAFPPLRGDALAYVIFTSGSTGRPKGVLIEHRGLANLITAQIETFAIDRDSVVLQFAPLSFDASVSEVFTALAAGATLCLAPRDELVPGPRLVELVRRHRVTVATLPPSSLALLDPADFPGLRTVVSAGEACTAALVARWAPGRRFVNAYGPTEVTVCATMQVCAADPRPPSIGAPLPSTTVELLDDALCPVAAGEIGELYVGGVGVARGYLGRPALTAERFLADPATPGARMYRTGDLARRRGDGALEFIGRRDHQVKVRGYRIELGEVESVLRAVAGVRDALAIAREEAAGDVRLIAYVVGDDALDRAALRAAVAARLPAFARPTDLVVLADWPRSPAGKIDRDALPAPRRTGSAGAARSDLELRLIEIWEDVLGVAGIGPDDDFFELGGHSLLAMRVIARVRTQLAVELPLSAIAVGRTIAGVARVIAEAGGRAALRSPLPLRTGGSQQALFLVPPVSGSALAYMPLLRHLRAPRPIHAFHAPGLDGRAPPPERFAALATHFVRELREVQPHGPYLLGGWSIGGALAFEMAVQLAADGCDVPALLMLDTNAPNPYLAEGIKQKLGALTPATLAFLYVQNFGRCFGVDLGLDKARFAALAPAELERVALAELRRVPAFPPDMDEQRLAAHLAVFAATARGFAAWRPDRRYAGRVVLFLARDGHPEFGAGRYDWADFVERPVDTLEVPGNHFSLVCEPHAAALAAELDRVLEAMP